MKTLLLTLFAFFTVSITVHSQTMEGTYTNTWESSAGGALTYTITLNPDKTFIFESHRVYESTVPAKSTTVVGTWKKKIAFLTLVTDASPEDIELVKKLNKSKARFKAYSPRHVKYHTVKPSLKFYKSKVFYAKRDEAEKAEDEADNAMVIN